METLTPPTGFAAILAANSDAVDDRGRPVRTASAAQRAVARAYRLNLTPVDDRTGENRRFGDSPAVVRCIQAYLDGRLVAGRIYRKREIIQIIKGSTEHFYMEMLQLDLSLRQAPFRLVTQNFKDRARGYLVNPC
jgi:hypothetical protein